MRHDMTTYFDAVLDDRMNPIFNGTQKQTLEWLESRPTLESEVQVCIGKSMQLVSVEKYLQQFG